MIARISTIALFFVVTALAGEDVKEPGVTRGEIRTWTDISGKFKIEAEYVALEDGIVTLERADGSTRKLPVEKLSESDREVAKRLGGGAQAGDEEGPSALAVKNKEGEVVKWAKTAYERNEKITQKIVDAVEGKRPLSDPDQPLDEVMTPVEEAVDRVKSLLAELAGSVLKDQAERLQDILSDEQPELVEFWKKSMQRDMQFGNVKRLNRIGMALWTYIEENDVSYPESLESILPLLGGSDTLVDTWGSPFIYLGKGITKSAPANTPIAVQDPKGQKKVAMLTRDGAVQFLSVPATGAVFKEPFQDLNKRLK